jgi:hypothetical protein
MTTGAITTASCTHSYCRWLAGKGCGPTLAVLQCERAVVGPVSSAPIVAVRTVSDGTCFQATAARAIRARWGLVLTLNVGFPSTFKDREDHWQCVLLRSPGQPATPVFFTTRMIVPNGSLYRFDGLGEQPTDEFHRLLMKLVRPELYRVL